MSRYGLLFYKACICLSCYIFNFLSFNFRRLFIYAIVFPCPLPPCTCALSLHSPILPPCSVPLCPSGRVDMAVKDHWMSWMLLLSNMDPHHDSCSFALSGCESRLSWLSPSIPQLIYREGVGCTNGEYKQRQAAIVNPFWVIFKQKMNAVEIQKPHWVFSFFLFLLAWS